MSDVKPVACINKKLMSRFVGMKTSTKKIFTVDMFEPGDIYLYHEETVLALQAEIEALRKDAVDAARWRALQKDRRTEIWTTGLHAYVDDAGLDEQADAAIAKEKQQESLK